MDNPAPHRPRWLLAAAGLALLAACQVAPAAPSADASATFERRKDAAFIPPTSELRRRLKVAPVARRQVREQITAPATVEADPSHLARIAAPLAGRVVKILVHYGDLVRAQQPLLLIDSPDLVAAQTDYLKARSVLLQANQAQLRQQDLLTHGIAAKREVEQANTDRAVAISELQRAHVRLKLLGIDTEQLGQPLVIRAPLTGRVVELGVATGEVHNDTNAAMMTIADLSCVWLTADVQEKDLHRVQIGDDAQARFAAYPGESFVGRVFSVADLLDADTRTIKVRTRFANADRRLKPGMFASATFTGSEREEVVVPSTALLQSGSETVVYVQTAPWTFSRRPVHTGAALPGDEVVVSDGLSAGELILTRDVVVLQ